MISSAITQKNILFVVSSIAQIMMFKQIIDQLTGYNVSIINVERWNKPSEIEKTLKGLDVPFSTISRISRHEFKNMLLKEGPDIVIFGNDNGTREGLLIECAKSMNIPTLLVQDGVLVDRLTVNKNSTFIDYVGDAATIPRRMVKFMRDRRSTWKQKKIALTTKCRSLYETFIFLLQNDFKVVRSLYGHGGCSEIAVFSEAVKDMFVREGIKEDRINVTGSPKFDKVFNYKNTDSNKKIRDELKIPADKIIILLVTQYFVEMKTWSREQRKKFVLSVADAVSSIPGSQLVIKIHTPTENEADYQEIIENLPVAPIICKQSNIYELVNASNTVLTVSSTVALESMAMERPVIIVNLFSTSGADFYRDSGALYVTKEEMLKPVLKQLISDQAFRENTIKNSTSFVYDQAYKQDGQASVRIANIIKKMAGQRNAIEIIAR